MAVLSTLPSPIPRKDMPAKTPHDRRPMDQLSRYLATLSEEGFFGKVVVSFQNGKVHDVKVEQTLKLDEL
jgi:hypothetical protein